MLSLHLYENNNFVKIDLEIVSKHLFGQAMFHHDNNGLKNCLENCLKNWQTKGLNNGPKNDQTIPNLPISVKG